MPLSILSQFSRQVKPFVSVRIVIILAACLALLILFALTIKRAEQPQETSNATARLQENYGQVPLHFEANHGQVNEQVKFLTRANGQNLFLTPKEAVVELKQKDRASALHMKLIGAAQNPVVKGEQQLEGTSNYFLGNDPHQWRTNVSTYARVKYESVYPGVDLVYYGNQQQLEYDFVVAPGADPNAIKLSFAGAEKMRLDDAGNLVLETASGTVKQHKPIIYQEVEGQRQEIAGNYVLEGESEVRFAVGEYDESKTLVIDPVLSYATFFGPGPGADSTGGYTTVGTAITVDAEGNVYLLGKTATPEFPTTAGAIRPTRLNQNNFVVFIAKFNAAGTSLPYSALLGGTSPLGDVQPNAITVDGEGNAYVTGRSAYSDFPRTRNSFANSDGKVFVTKFNADASKLLFSTVIGGGGSEEGLGIALDREGNIGVAGRTNSSAFPISENAFQKKNEGNEDGFVLKLTGDGRRLLFSTFIGGGTKDWAECPVFDEQGNIYFSGQGGGISNAGRYDYKPFPTTFNAFMSSADPQVVAGGGYVAKLDATGSNLIFSTMVGAGGNKMALDKQGYIYVAGVSRSNDFPVTPGAFRLRGGTENQHSSREDGIVMKLSPDGSRVIYSTFINSTEEATRLFELAVDAEGCAHIFGNSPFAGFPYTTALPRAVPALPSRSNFQEGGFVVKLKADGSGVIYSAFIPVATADDNSGGMALDAQGNVYLTGNARQGLPVTENAYQPDYQNPPDKGFHAFIVKLANRTRPESFLPLNLLPENPRSQGTFPVAGRIKDTLGRPVEGVTVNISASHVAARYFEMETVSSNWKNEGNGRMSMARTTDSNGFYPISVGFPAGANYIITPTKPGYTFNPPTVTLNLLGKEQVVSFTATSNNTERVTVNVSAASYERALAYNSITSAFGSDLATKTLSANTLPLPTNLGGTTVTVRDLTGALRYAPLFFVSPTQVNYLMPPGTHAGRVVVTIRNANGLEATEILSVSDTAPGLFSADASGRGVAAATVQRIRANGKQSVEVISQFDFSRGQIMAIPIDLGAEGDIVYLSLYGTGVRHRRELSNVGATVGGMKVRVAYAGLQNSYAGLDQVNVMIPRELAGRGEVDVVLSVDGKLANVVKVKIK
ncbi:MAG: SBBP repeat-containing protein [Acidobacteria bacterium]|nr:SBBP repeat-containing protein [Acidobacteriota bacterium]